MTIFRPTHAPPGRLVRLAVVLDTRNTPERLREIARMCDRAGVDALWVGDHSDGRPRLEAWTALVLAGLEVSRARIGAMLEVTLRPASLAAAMAATLNAAVGGRVEIGFRAVRSGGPAPAAGTVALPRTRVDEYATTVRSLLTGAPATTAETTGARPPNLGPASPGAGGPPISVDLASPGAIDAAVRVADDVVVRAGSTDAVRAAIAQVRTGCEAAGRDPRSLGIAVELPVSIGRTSAEARARASSEPLFGELGDPARIGVVGTLEQCQDRVIELAHLGVTDLRCVLPNTPDVHDAIAQLTAAVVGSIDVLAPNAPRSRPPDPPAGWGGRPPTR